MNQKCLYFSYVEEGKDRFFQSKSYDFTHSLIPLKDLFNLVQLEMNSTFVDEN